MLKVLMVVAIVLAVLFAAFLVVAALGYIAITNWFKKQASRGVWCGRKSSDV